MRNRLILGFFIITVILSINKTFGQCPTLDPSVGMAGAYGNGIEVCVQPGGSADITFTFLNDGSDFSGFLLYDIPNSSYLIEGASPVTYNHAPGSNVWEVLNVPDEFVAGINSVYIFVKSGCPTYGGLGIDIDPSSELRIEDADITLTHNTRCTPVYNGAIEIIASGGHGNISYQWTGPSGFSSTDINISDLDPGTYTITLTDELNCTYVRNIDVLDNSVVPVISFSGLDPSGQYCGNDPAVLLTGDQAPNGTFAGPGITDNLNGTANFDPASAGAGGNIVYTYTDPLGCTGTYQEAVVINTPPTSAVLGSDQSVCQAAGGTLTVTITGGTGPYEVQLDNGLPLVTNYNSGDPIAVTPATTTTYSLVSVVDANGCSPTTVTGTATVTITNATDATLASDQTICLGDNGTLTVTITGGIGPFDVQLDNGLPLISNYNSGDPITVSPLVTTTYNLISVVGSDGCPALSLTGSPTVTVSTPPTSAVLGADQTICEGTSATLSVIITGGTSPYDVQLDNGIPLINNYNSGDPITVSPAISTTYNLISVVDAGGCIASGLSGSPIVTVAPLPIANDQTPATCEDAGTPGTATGVDLTALNGSINGGAVTITWYEDAGLATPVADATNVTVSNGDDFYAEVDDGTCTNVATVTYTVNPLPSAANQAANVCEDTPGSNTATGVNLTTLNTSINGGAVTITWYEDAGLTTPVADATNVTINGSFTYYAEVDDGTCTNVATAAYTVIAAPVANDQTPSICEDAGTPGIAAGIDLTALNAAIDGGAGNTITWYEDAALTTLVADATNVTVNNGDDFYAEVDNGNCTTVATVTYTVNPLPTATNPVVAPLCEDSFGGGTTAGVDLTALNGSINGGAVTITWYEDAGLATPVADATNVTVSNGDDFYAEVDDGTCTNVATVTYTVNPLPSAANQAANVCEDTPGSNTATGVNLTTLNTSINGGAVTITWYEDAGLATPVADATNVTITGSFTYYAEVDDGTCTNVATAAYTVIAAPVANDQTPSVCEDAGTPGIAAGIDLTALNGAIDGGAGNTITWYEDAGLATPVADATNVTVNNGDDFYAEVDNGNCTTVATVTYTVNPLPTATNPVVAPLCEDSFGGGTVAGVDLTALNGSINGGAVTITWYEDAGLATPVADATNVTVSNGDDFYAEVDDGTCTNVATVTYTVNPLPSAVNQVANVCEDTPGSNTATGVNLTTLNTSINGGAVTITWYEDAGLTTPVADATNVTINGSFTYYAEVDDGTCTNLATAAYTVIAAPVANNQTPSVCEDAGTPGSAAGINLTTLNGAIDGGAGNTITWYEDAGLATPVADATNVTINNGDDFYAEVDNGNCTTVATVTYTVNPLPTATNPVVAPLCEDSFGGGTVAGVDLTALNGSINGGAVTITWYEDAGLATPVADATNVTVSNGDDFYAEVDDGTCTNVATVTYTVNPLPSAANQAANVCEDTPGSNTATGVNLTSLNTSINGGAVTITWYEDAGLTTLVADATNVTITGSFTYYAEVDDGTCTNVATAAYTVIAAPVANDQTPSVCEDAGTPGSAAGINLTTLNGAIDGGAGNTITWYEDAGLATPVADATNVTVNNGDDFYAEVDNGGCTNVAMVTYTVIAPPTANNQTPAPICEDVFGSGTVAGIDLTALNNLINGGAVTIIWYEDAGLTTLVPDATNVTVGNGDDFFAEVDNGSCTNVATVTYTVDPLPSAANQAENICEDTPGSGIASGIDLTTLNNLINSGAVTITWYEDAGLTTLVADATNVTINGNFTYYAEVDDGTCTNVATAAYTVVSAPTANDQTPTVCEDSGTPGQASGIDLTALNSSINNGAVTITWYEDAALTILVADAANTTVSDAQIFYAQVDDGGCTNVAEVTYSVVASAPDATNPLSNQYCEGTSRTSVSVDTPPAGYTVFWYDVAAGGFPITTGESFTPATPGDYYAELQDVSGCASANRVLATLTMNPRPADLTLIGNATPDCQSSEIYSVEDRPGSSYTWTAPPNATIDAPVDNYSVTINYRVTDGDVTVVETDANGCQGNLVVLPVALQNCAFTADFSTFMDIRKTCIGSFVTFINGSKPNTPAPGTTFFWDFGPDAVPATANTEGPHNVYYTTSGLKTVTLVMDDGAGTVSTEVKTNYINVTPVPTFGIYGDNVICRGSSTDVTFEMNGTFPFEFGYYTATDYYDVDALSAPYVVNVSPTTDTEYIIDYVQDSVCEAAITTNNSVMIRVVDSKDVTIKVDSVVSPPNTQVSVPVRLENYDYLQTMQFTVQWDPALLSYSGVTNLMNGVTPSNFGTADISSGFLTFSWNTPSGNDTTIADNAAIFDLLFDVANTFCGDAPVSIDMSPTALLPPLMTDEALCTAVIDTEGGNVDIQATITLNSSDSDNTICYGDPVMFTTIPVGLADYEFFLNGTSVQAGTNNVYVIDTLKDGDQVMVRVSDGLSCLLDSPPITTSVTQLVVGTDVTDITSCGAADGAIEITSVTGGTAPYTYAWTGPSIADPSLEDQVNLAYGLYEVTVTDGASSCTEVISHELHEPANFVLDTVSVTHVTVNGSNDGAIDISITAGSGDYTINWIGPGGFTSTDEDISSLIAGQYRVDVLDNISGCSDFMIIDVTEPISILTLTYTKTDITSCTTPDGSIDLTISGGVLPYLVSWIDPNGNFVSNSEDLANLSIDGAYSVTVSDGSGQRAYETVQIIDFAGFNLTAAVTDITECTNANGTISLTITGGSGNFTFDWKGLNGLVFSSTDQDIIDLERGDYRVIVTDAILGCVDSLDATVGRPLVCDQPCALDVAPYINNTTCPDASNGSAVLLVYSGGSGPGNYYVSVDTGRTYIPFGQPEVMKFENLPQGSYYYIVSDTVTSCKDTVLANVGIAIDIAHSITVTDPGCDGDDGRIRFNLSGGVAPYYVELIDSVGTVYTQSGSGFIQFFNLTPGSYYYNISESSHAGCFISSAPTDSVELVIDCSSGGCTTLSATATNFVDATCTAEPDGQATITVTGGTSPYQYTVDGTNWIDFISGNPVNQLPPNGIYNVVIRQDAANPTCRDEVQVEINGPPPITLDGPIITVQRATCNANDGSVEISTVSGGVAPYTYRLDDVPIVMPTDRILTGLGAGYHTLTVVDAGGCETDFSFLVDSPGVIVINRLEEIPVECSAIDLKAGIYIELDLTATTVAGPYVADIALASDPSSVDTYQITDMGTRTIFGLDKDFYEVTVRSTGEPGCANTQQLPVFSGASPVDFDILEYDTVVNCLGSGGSITIGNVIGDNNKTYIVQLVSADNTVLDSYELYYPELANGFSIDESNSDNITSGTYVIKVIQNQDGCPNIISTSDAIKLYEPEGGLDFVILDEGVSITDRPTGYIEGEVIPSGGRPYEAIIQLVDPTFELSVADIIEFNSKRTWEEVRRAGNDLNKFPHRFDTLYAGEYEIRVRDDYGCEVSMEYLVKFDENIFIPNVFTPNNDGSNDLFYIRNLPDTGTKMIISNRWGKTIFHTDNYTIDNLWDGGEEADGVFFYQMTLPNGETYNGWVEMWRGAKP